MGEALIAAGVRLITCAPSGDYDLAVTITSPDHFQPVRGTRNLLFTQTEFSAPHVWSDAIQEATAVVTSCRHSAEVIARHYPGPIEICPLGIDPVIFPFYQRKAPAAGTPFRFLFMGNLLDERKGAKLLLGAWSSWQRLARMPRCELYMKGNGALGGSVQHSPPSFGARLVIDTRNLTEAELAALYNRAHAFVMPSCGEGFGLTLCEAMGTGLPAAWTHWSAPVDYANERMGFPISQFRMVRFEQQAEIGEPCFGAAASEAAIIEAMEEIVRDYPRALALGRRASERMHSQYTWEQSATRFIEICERALVLPITPRLETMSASA
jgi:glycosyltransferase involved in cell wall biosynthesis